MVYGNAIFSLAEDISRDIPDGVDTVFIVLNPGFGWLDFEELEAAIKIVCPKILLKEIHH